MITINDPNWEQYVHLYLTGRLSNDDWSKMNKQARITLSRKFLKLKKVLKKGKVKNEISNGQESN